MPTLFSVVATAIHVFIALGLNAAINIALGQSDYYFLFGYFIGLVYLQFAQLEKIVLLRNEVTSDKLRQEKIKELKPNG